MTKAVVQTKEILVDSKQKILSARFTRTNRFKCEFLLVILSFWNSNYSVVTSLSPLYPFTVRASSGVDYFLLAKNIIFWVVKAVWSEPCYFEAG